MNFGWVQSHWLRTYRPGVFGGLSGGRAAAIVTLDSTYTALPKALFVLSFGASALLAFVRPRTFVNFLRYSLLGYLAYFTFNTGVHENHLFVAIILAALLCDQDRNEIILAGGVIGLSTMNLFFFAFRNHPARVVGGIDLAVPAAIAATCFFVVTWVREALKPRRDRARPAADEGPAARAAG
jgi:hypothetical protein